MKEAVPHRADAIVTVRSPSAHVVRSDPGDCGHYSNFRPHLRWDFWYSCAFCTLTESEGAGVGFEIDHYLPQHRYPELRDTYSNLLWTCSHCNQYKGDYPTEPAALKGYRFYRPDMDDPRDHFAVSPLSPTRLDAKTEEVGRYTIEQLNLNRQTLRRLRELRSRLYRSRDILVRGLRQLEGTKLDQLPAETRAKFVAVRSRLSKEGETVSEVVNEALLRYPFRCTRSRGHRESS